MLEPTTLPIAISVFPLMLANRLTINSGEDVPNDTMVSPITMLEMLYFWQLLPNHLPTGLHLYQQYKSNC